MREKVDSKRNASRVDCSADDHVANGEITVRAQIDDHAVRCDVECAIIESRTALGIEDHMTRVKLDGSALHRDRRMLRKRRGGIRGQ